MFQALQALITFAVAVSVSLPSSIASSLETADNKAEKAELFTSLYSQILTTPEQIAFGLALSGVEANEIKAIEDDLVRRAAGAPFRPMRLEGNQFYVDGQQTGARIVSYQPYNIEYRGRTWSYDRHQSVDQNYFALLKMLEAKPNARLQFIDEANAIETRDAATLGAIAGMGTLGIVAIFLAPVSIPVAVAVVGGSMLLGAGSGMLIGHAVNKQESISNMDGILKSNFTLSCNKNEIVLVSSDKGFSVAAKIDHRDGNKVKYSAYGEYGTFKKVAALTAKQQAVLSSLSTCNESNSEEMQARMRRAYATVASIRSPASGNQNLRSGPAKNLK